MTITRDKDVLGSEPRIEGTRVGVRHIAEKVIEGGYTPAYVSDQLDVSLSEVYEALSYYYENQPEPPFDYVTVVLNRDRDALYDRINRRVDNMLDDGLLDEVREVMELDGVQLDEPPLSTIGYREPIQYLRGEIEYDEMVRLVKRNSRRYAKRQLTWFRRYDEYHWRSATDLGAEDLTALWEEKR